MSAMRIGTRSLALGIGLAALEAQAGVHVGHVIRDDTLNLLDPKKKTYMAMTRSDFDELSGIGRVDGVPILTRSFTDGRPDGTESIVKEWTTRANPANLIEVPADYRLRKP